VRTVTSIRRGRSPVVGKCVSIPFVPFEASTVDGACSAVHTVNADLTGCQAYNRSILDMSSMCCSTFSAFKSIPKHPCR